MWWIDHLSGERYHTPDDPRSWRDIPDNGEAERYHQMFAPPDFQRMPNGYGRNYFTDPPTYNEPAPPPATTEAAYMPTWANDRPLNRVNIGGAFGGVRRGRRVEPAEGEVAPPGEMDQVPVDIFTVRADNMITPAPLTATQILAAREQMRITRQLGGLANLTQAPQQAAQLTTPVQFIKAFRQDRASTKISFIYIDGNGNEKAGLITVSGPEGTLEDKQSLASQVGQKLRGGRRPMTNNIANDMFQLLTLVMDDEQLQKQYGNEWEAVIEAYEGDN